LAEELRTRLAELAVPDQVEFVSLTSALSDKPLRAEMVAAGALVALLSRHATREARVMTETGLAVSLGTPVIAVITDDTSREVLDFVEAKVWIPAADTPPGDLASAIHKVVRELLSDSNSA
jgi:hypothetical protein